MNLHAGCAKIIMPMFIISIIRWTVQKQPPLAELLKNRYDAVVIGVHNYNRYPANDFGISKAALWLMQQLQQQNKTVTIAFGNPYCDQIFL